MPASQTIVGACLCGTVQFQIVGKFEGFFLCHCSRCRKDSGSAHAANLFASAATVTWRSGQDSIRTYRLAGTRHTKSFCIECGSTLPRSSGAGLMVPAGSIDSPIERRPDAHICFADRANWDDHLETIARLDGLPGAP
jgi:hypothetical protein